MPDSYYSRRREILERHQADPQYFENREEIAALLGDHTNNVILHATMGQQEDLYPTTLVRKFREKQLNGYEHDLWDLVGRPRSGNGVSLEERAIEVQYSLEHLQDLWYGMILPRFLEQEMQERAHLQIRGLPASPVLKHER